MAPKLTWLEEIYLKMNTERLPTTAAKHANLSPKPAALGEPLTQRHFRCSTIHTCLLLGVPLGHAKNRIKQP